MRAVLAGTDRNRREDLVAGCRDVDLGPGARVAREGIVLARVGDRDRLGVGGRVRDGAAVDQVVERDDVARGSDDGDARHGRVVDRRREGRRDVMPAEADVDDVHVVGDRPVQGGDQPAVVARTRGTEHLEPPELDARGDADDQVAVVVRGEDAGDVGPVAVVVHRVGIVVHEVVAALVRPVEFRVDDGRLLRGGPVVDVVDPGVDDGHPDALAADPRLVDGVGPDVPDTPGVVVFEVTRRGVEELQAAVPLDRDDVLVVAQAVEGRRRHRRGEPVDHVVGEADVAAGGPGCGLGRRRDDRARR